MGDISFPNIPQNIRVPLFYADLDPSNANTGQQTLRALLIGQFVTGSPAVPDMAQICQGVSATKALAGQGSMLALEAAGADKAWEAEALVVLDGDGSGAGPTFTASLSRMRRSQ